MDNTSKNVLHPQAFRYFFHLFFRRQPLIFTMALTIGGLSCDRPSVANPTKIPTYTDDAVNVVVEIPAGTNHKIEYNKASGKFENVLIEGKPRIIDFLPYPGNYGFIPATHMDPEQGGDGDALDVLVLSESVPTGTVLTTRPIGAIRFRDSGEIDTKIIAIPIDSTQRIIQADQFIDFLIKYDAAKKIIEDWFLNYKGYGAMELIEWRDEKYALQEIKRWEE